MTRSTVEIMGYEIDSTDIENAVESAFINPGHIVTINPEMIQTGKNNPEFSQIIKDAQMVVPDGVGITLGLKILGKNAKRIPGIELGKELLKKAAKDNKSVALIGAKDYIIELAANNIKKEIPNINIVYVKDGYFNDETQIIEDLKNCTPDLLLVALGSPKQEFFINKLKSVLPNSVMIGLGGSFDVWSGVVKRAPVLYQKLGLEWLYRTISEPQRIKRIFPAIPFFLFDVLKERLNCK